MAPPADPDAAAWTFFTNHAHVLFCLAADREARLRDIAAQVGITERAVQRIIAELEEAGYVTREHSGRRNPYCVNASLPLRHPLEARRSVGSLLAVVVGQRQRCRGSS